MLRLTPFTAWMIGVAAYLFAGFNRSSLGVAGLLAVDRFHISAAELSVFTMVQLLVYACGQVPAGLLVDRFGPRAVLTCGAVLMTAAQAGFALATTYPEGIAARIVLGAGDAMTFISVVRLIALWMNPRGVALYTQLTGAVGQIGGIAAAIPLSMVLQAKGWTTSYLLAAALGPLVIAALLLVLRDAPEARTVRGTPLGVHEVSQNIRVAWRQPGTRLGFWVHFTLPFSATALGLLWGFPFLVKGEGLSHSTAAALLSLLTFAAAVCGPLLGWFVGRHPWHRSTMALVLIAAMAVIWAAVLLWHGTTPIPLLVVLMLVCGVGGPASLIGIDMSRTSNAAQRQGSASGLVNTAGFFASLIAVVGIGLVLDLQGSGTDYPLGAFRPALAFQYALWFTGVIQIVRYRLLLRNLVSREQVLGGDTSVDLVR
ncbi:MFS transporter [Nocardioides baekrokdamisoli]|uniref:Lysosomal dipeptide transporter MFSD1 n=1 Tax=Nocardioides baekrokdamisoli TaxID=1804624 RepID=A0A3G9IB43_9ACTN|nr:MFS transporter [Nocardioides baekrokdamisoli]BBH16000.1 MFS transporter [Nocardioides baekrokdamisoli]